MRAPGETPETGEKRWEKAEIREGGVGNIKLYEEWGQSFRLCTVEGGELYFRALSSQDLLPPSVRSARRVVGACLLTARHLPLTAISPAIGFSPLLLAANCSRPRTRVMSMSITGPGPSASPFSGHSLFLSQALRAHDVLPQSGSLKGCTLAGVNARPSKPPLLPLRGRCLGFDCLH